MHFATDTVTDAITTDGGDTYTDEFTLDETTTTTIDNPPWQRAFDTDTFYKLTVVAARPIKQQYDHGGKRRTFKKTTDALKTSAWSMDNAPYPLTHPDTGPIANVDDVHGFLKQPRWVEDWDGKDYGALVADLYVPTNDDDAQSFLADHRAVSVGFFNDLDWDTDEDDIDAYQTNLYFDHVAGVRVGRCPVEAGCGVMADDGEINLLSDNSCGAKDHCSAGACSCGEHVPTVDAPSGIYVGDDGNWYGVGPTETSDDKPKYALNDCNDVKDAYNLRNNGDYDIDTSTLVTRIERAADAHDCGTERKPWVDDSNTTTDSDTMTDDNSDDDTDIDFDSLVEGMSVDSLAESNDEVASLVEDKNEAQNRVEVLEDKTETLENDNEELREELETYREDEKEDIVDEITDLTSAWDEDDLMDEDLDELQTKKTIAEDAATSPSTPSEDSPSDDNSPTTDNDPTSDDDSGMTVSNEHRSWG